MRRSLLALVVGVLSLGVALPAVAADPAKPTGAKCVERVKASAEIPDAGESKAVAACNARAASIREARSEFREVRTAQRAKIKEARAAFRAAVQAAASKPEAERKAAVREARKTRRQAVRSARKEIRQAKREYRSDVSAAKQAFRAALREARAMN